LLIRDSAFISFLITAGVGVGDKGTEIVGSIEGVESGVMASGGVAVTGPVGIVDKQDRDFFALL